MIVLNQGLDGFFHSLIPERLRTTLEIGGIDYIRVRALSSMLATTSVVTGLSSLGIISKHLMFNPELLSHDIVSLAIVFVFALQTWLFYRFSNHWISALAFTNIYFIVAVVTIVISGGFDSPMTCFLLTCPVMSFLIGGITEGVQNSVFTLLVGLVLTFLKSIGFELGNVFAGESRLLLFGMSWVGTLIILTSCILVYDLELQERRLPPSGSR